MPRYSGHILTVCFLIINLISSYAFFNVNTAKLVGTLSSCFVLLITLYYQYPAKKVSWDGLKASIILITPILFTFPGLIFSGWQHNYNLNYELSAFLMFSLIALASFEIFKDQKQISIFIKGLILLILYVFIDVALESRKISVPSDISKLKSVFGNRNYMAAFLIQVLPFTFALFLSSLGLGPDKEKGKIFGLSSKLYLIPWALSLLILLYARSRAGIGAAFLSLFIVISAFLVMRIDKEKRKKMSIYLILSFMSLFALYTVFYFSTDFLQNKRLFNIFTYEGWFDRIHSYEAALRSIKESPLFGHGLGSSYNLYFLFVSPAARLTQQARSYNHAHSELIELIQEGGLFALLTHFIVWGFILFKLFKVITDQQTSKKNFALATGLLGVFIAYHTQSLVSVAPRMAAARLPLFLFGGLAFTLFPSTNSKSQSYQRPLATFLPLGLLLLSSILFIPWAKKQHQHQELTRVRRHNIKNLNKYISLMKTSEDVYTQQSLAFIFNRFQKPGLAIKAIDKSQALIPHYRNTDTLKGLAYMQRKDYHKAYQAFKTMQKYDRYHIQTTQELLLLSVILDDYNEFKNQMTIVSKIALRRSSLLGISAMRFSKAQVGPFKDVFNVEPHHEESLFVKLQERFVRSIFEELKQKRTKTDKRSAKQKIINFISTTIAQGPYFQIIPIKGSSKVSAADINRLIGEYFQIVTNLPRIKEKQKAKSRQKKIDQKLSALISWEDTKKRVMFGRYISNIITASVIR